jgi:uncharacterized protein
MTEVKQMVSYISKALADKPDAIEIDEIVGESVVMLELKVADEDMGRIIGREGRHINAIRSLARVLGGKMGKRISLELVDDHSAANAPSQYQESYS